MAESGQGRVRAVPLQIRARQVVARQHTAE